MDFVFVFCFDLLYEKVPFCIFVLTSAWNLSLLKQLHIATESFHYTLLENGIMYRGLDKRSWDTSNSNIKKDAYSAEI